MAITQTIQGPSAIPNRVTDMPEQFSVNAITSLTDQAAMAAQQNTYATQANALATQVNADAATSGANAIIALNASNAAIGAANYKGTWEGKTGAGVIGESYLYKASFIYRLNVNLANLSTSVPSPTNTDWVFIQEVPFEAPCKATLDLDCANQKAVIYSKLEGFVEKPFSDIVSQGRATAGGSTDAIGGVTEFSAGENRFTFDGETGGALGYLSEESRTRLNTIYIAPTANENITTTAQIYTLSMWGTGTITLSGTNVGTLVGVDSSTRVARTFTATAGTLTLAYSGACLNVQLEAGSFPTSLIQGAEGVARLRSADSMTRTLGQEWSPNEGTFVVELSPSIYGLNPRAFFAGSVNSHIQIVKVGSGNLSNTAWNIDVKGSVETFSRLSLSSGSKKIAISYNNVLKTLIASSDLSSSVQTTFTGSFLSTQFYFMSSPIPSPQNQSTGTIKRIRYYPRAFDSLTLQRLSRIQ